MFHLPDSLLIGSFLLKFVFSEALLQARVPVRWCVGVKHSDIYKGSLQSSSPEAVCRDVESGVIGGTVRLAMVSEESGWRSGSTHTSLQTSVIRVAVRCTTVLLC